MNRPRFLESSEQKLSAGRVLLNARNHAPAHRNIFPLRRDGSSGFSLYELADALLEPHCQAGLFSSDDPATPGKTRRLSSSRASLERADVSNSSVRATLTR
jgi:hypothetical protein